MTFRSTIRDLVPPIVTKSYRKIVDRERPDALFGGDDRLFREKIAGARRYGEYGVGQSTLWALENANCSIFAVDTSSTWIETVKTKSNGSPRLNLVHVDLGDLSDWGRPKNYAHRDRFKDYVASPWTQAKDLDVVLIDGRFRVASFLYSLLQAAPGSSIIFDDYINREHYHVVEEFAPRAETCGRQALFVVPANLDRPSIETAMNSFMYVMD